MTSKSLMENMLERTANKHKVPAMKDCKTLADVFEYARRTKSKGAYLTAIATLQGAKSLLVFQTNGERSRMSMKGIQGAIDKLKEDYSKYHG